MVAKEKNRAATDLFGATFQHLPDPVRDRFLDVFEHDAARVSPEKKGY